MRKLMIGYVILWVIIVTGIGAVAYHFIEKYW